MPDNNDLIPSPKQQQKELVIKLIKDRKSHREIATIAKISLRDIGIIKRELYKEPEPEPVKSTQARAYQMFYEGKTPIQVAISLDLDYTVVDTYYNQFLRLTGKENFIRLYAQLEPYLPLVAQIIEKMKIYQLSPNDLNALLIYMEKLKEIDRIRDDKQHKVNCLEVNAFRLEQEINAKKNTLSDINTYINNNCRTG